MALANNVKEKISMEVIKTLKTRFDNFPEDASNNRNAPFHEAFLRAFSDKLDNNVSDVPFFISLASWLHGLNTTLGQTFFERIAHILCNGEKREYTSKKLGNLKITQKQKELINSIVSDLSSSNFIPNLTNENAKIFQNEDSPLVSAMDFSTDVFFEDKNSVVAIELKTVKPNSGEMRGEKHKILEGKVALYRNFPNKKIKFFIGFPFDPTIDPANEARTSFDKTRFLNSIINMNKYFDHTETLVASELWDFLSGEKNTMEEILHIINTISTTAFLEKFNLLADHSKRNTSKYLKQLKEWNLFSEKNLIENDSLIVDRLIDNEKTRTYNKMPFDTRGNYDWGRYDILKELL
jgi:hypothetical protein